MVEKQVELNDTVTVSPEAWDLLPYHYTEQTVCHRAMNAPLTLYLTYSSPSGNNNCKSQWPQAPSHCGTMSANTQTRLTLKAGKQTWQTIVCWTLIGKKQLKRQTKGGCSTSSSRIWNLKLNWTFCCYLYYMYFSWHYYNWISALMYHSLRSEEKLLFLYFV